MASFISSPPTMSTWQIAFGSTVIGGPGTQVDITSITGVTDLPDIASGDTPRPRDQGSHMGLDFMTGRTIHISLTAVKGATSLPLILDASTRASTTAAPGSSGSSLVTQAEFPLWVCLPTIGIVGAMVRCRKRNIPIDLGYTLGLANIDFEFYATDPRLYSPSATSTGSITNSGNWETRPTYSVSPTGGGFTISATGPTSGSITINASVPSGSHFVFDSYLRTFNLVDGSGIKTNWRSNVSAVPDWWNINPGGTYSVTSSAGTLTCTYSSAWIL